MSFNISPTARVVIYVLNLLGAPVVVYLRARNIIGDLELTLWGAEVSAMSLLAGVHVPPSDKPRGEAGVADLGALVLFAILVCVVLILFGVKVG